MKKLLFSTLALAAVVVASPVLANENNGGFELFDENTPALKDSPQKPAPGSEHGVPEAPKDAVDFANLPGSTVNNTTDNPEAGKAGDYEPFVEIDKDGNMFLVVKWPGGENRVLIKDREVTEKDFERIMLGVPVPGKETEKSAEETKAVEKASKEAAKEAAKSAAKAGQKVLPNTAAVK